MGSKKRHLISLFLVIVCTVVFISGCGGNKQTPAETQTPPAETQTPSAETQTPSADAPVPTPTETVVLKLSHSHAAQSVTGRSYDYFAQTLAEESGGTIQIDVSPSGSLVSDADLLDAVQKGNIDMGHINISYVTPVIKELTPLEVPGTYSASKFIAFSEGIRPVLNNIVNQYGIRYVGAVGSDNMAFVGKNSIKSPADLKNAKVRAAGKWLGEAIKVWGGSAVTISIADLTNALERGTVDAALTNWIPIMSFKLYEVADYVSVTEIPASFSGLIMSDKAWQKLSPEQQEAVVRSGQKLEAYNLEITQNDYDTFLQNAEAEGCEVYTLSAEENASFKTGLEGLMKEVETVAGPGGAELIAYIQEMSKS